MSSGYGLDWNCVPPMRKGPQVRPSGVVKGWTRYSPRGMEGPGNLTHPQGESTTAFDEEERAERRALETLRRKADGRMRGDGHRSAELSMVRTVAANSMVER